MRELLQEFLIESHENLDQLDQDLVGLETNRDPEVLSRIFRVVHTLKGSCGFLGFTTLESVAHEGENLLGLLRDGDLIVSAEIITALLTLVDTVRKILNNIEMTEAEGEVDVSLLLATLVQLQGKPGEAGAPQDPASEPAAPPMASAADGVAAMEDKTAAPSDLESLLIGAYEQLDALEQSLAQLESAPEHAAAHYPTMLSCARAIESLSAGSSCTRLGAMARGLGELLQLPQPPDSASLHKFLDGLNTLLGNLETTGNEGDAQATATHAPPDQSASATITTPGPTVQRPVVPSAAQRPPPSQPPSPPVAQAPAPSAETKEPETQRAAESVTAPVTLSPPRVDQTTASAAGMKVEAPAATSTSVAETSIRVDVGLLDDLVDQVGELVLARNRIRQFGREQQDRRLSSAHQRLDLIATELQESVMKTRMQPIRNLWNKFPRVARDLALECRKQVALTMEGEDTELDRTLLEAIRDPLTHLVRNAVDHGIESPVDRSAAGKPEIGTVALRAYHEGGQVNIEIADDGAGIDPERVAQKALSSGLISAADASRMSQQEIQNLIFRAGFSTAATVTHVSGRGVGMDVVRSNIEKINGTVDIHSRVGSGTTMSVKIPLTLAIVSALVVHCAGERYAIPQANLIELVRLSGDGRDTRIERFHGAPVYRLRGRLLPLVYLRELLQVGDGALTTVNIVVLQANGCMFGLVVDAVQETEEIVVKPLGKMLKHLSLFAGSTIMGDGRVSLILDVVGLAQEANVLASRQESGYHSDWRAVSVEAPEEDTEAVRQALLVVEVEPDQSLALPLDRVTRLERIAHSAVEKAGHRNVVQYWGQIMVLIDLSDLLRTSHSAPMGDDPLEVVVVNLDAQEPVGLVVRRIVDIMEETYVLHELKSRDGIVGTIVLHKKVMEIIDLDRIVEMADPALMATARNQREAVVR